jgi:hypothetical protein
MAPTSALLSTETPSALLLSTMPGRVSEVPQLAPACKTTSRIRQG